MLFNSYSFLLFFPVVVLVYFLIPKRIKYIWLLIASYFFYMCWDAKYALILLFSTAVTYTSGLLISNTNKRVKSRKKRRKYKIFFVALSFIINLSVLFLFKYFDFAVENINKILSHLGIQLVNPEFDVVLPVGISFYIFQALSYTMDVYRGDVRAEKNFLRYALFVSFFPQLVAGPIERSKNLLRQVNANHKFDAQRVKDGLLLMIWGGVQKIVIADRIAVVVDKIFNNFPTYSGMYVVVAAVLFAFQIYCDFAGYSTIAIGAAKVMGFDLMENFNCPYFARSVSEFWRRWHISLSSWFKDYLYIPLGGNRRGKTRKHLNIMAVFIVSGLWHGANWSFVVWGALNGLFQVIGERLAKLKKWFFEKLHIKRDTNSRAIAEIVVTFFLIDFTWIFFRAPTLKIALRMISSVFSNFNPWILFDGSLYNLGLDRKEFQFMVFSIILLMAVDFIKWRGKSVRQWVYKQNRVFRWAFYIISILFVLIFGIWGSNYDSSAFIYFQF